MREIKIFIVESRPVFRQSLFSALEEMAPVRLIGWAEDEISASSWLRLHAFDCDLMIADVALQRGSGLTLLKLVSELPCQMRSVILTSYSSPEIRRRCAENGAQRVFDNSYEIDDLFAYCTELAIGKGGADGRNRTG
jgi:DNA-binding NarL/FixJ family response regulator